MVAITAWRGGANVRTDKAPDPLSQYPSIISRMQVLFRYLLASNKRNLRSFLIGSLTVFLTVMFLSLLQNALSRTTSVFLKLAQDQVGEFDFILTSPELRSPSSFTDALTNTSLIRSKLSEESSVAGVAARWLIRGNISSAAGFASATVIIMDSAYERSIGLAPLWPYRTLGSSEAHVSSSLLRALRAQPQNGEKIEITFDLADQLKAIGNVSSLFPPNLQISATIITQLPPPLLVAFANATNLTDIANSNNSLTIPTEPLIGFVFNNQAMGARQTFSVINAIESPYNKYPPSLGNVVVLEKSFIKGFLDNWLASIGILSSRASPRLFEQFEPDDYSMFSVVLLNDRKSIYEKSHSQRNADVIDRSNAIATALGIGYPVKIIDVLNQALGTSRFLGIFLSELFFTVISILGILATILITSLLLSDIEEKTFEYGMLRTLGLREKDLIGLLSLQSFLFSIPGIALGLLVCFLLSIPIGIMLSTYTGTPYNLSLDHSSVILGILFGLVLPLLGILLPVRRALTKTIRDALDVYHNVVYDTSVRVQRLANIGLSVDETIVSLILSVLTADLIPLSFVFGNLAMFFRILTTILLGMVCGQVLLSQSVQTPSEIVMAKILTTIIHPKLFDITNGIITRLALQLARNRKTAAMYTLCLSYIIFASAMFSLQTSSFSQNMEWINGADISVKGPGLFKPLPENQLKQYLETKLVTEVDTLASSVDEIVINYSFVTYSLTSFVSVTSASISRLASISESSVEIYGLESNYLDVVKTSYYVPVEFNKESYSFNDSVDAVNALFQQPLVHEIPVTAVASANSDLLSSYSDHLPVMFSDAIRDTAIVNAKNPVILNLGLQSSSTGTSSKSFLALPVCTLRKMPGFPSINRLVTSKTPLFLSIQRYEELMRYIEQRDMNVTAGDISAAPKGTLMIRVSDKASSLQIEALVNSLNSLLNDQAFSVTNLREQIASTESAANLVSDIFVIVAIIGVILSFFVLFLSFIANVRESSWQLGVLRAIGLTKKSVILIYVYEALSVVLACTFLAFLLGCFTAVTLTLQSNLFTEMPFVFVFPGALITIVTILCLITAIVGSYIPIDDFNKRPIAVTLRG